MIDVIKERTSNNDLACTFKTSESDMSGEFLESWHSQDARVQLIYFVLKT